MALPPILPAPSRSQGPALPPILPPPPNRQTAAKQAGRAIAQVGKTIGTASHAIAPPPVIAPKALRSGDNPRGTRIAAPAPGHAGGATITKVVSDIFNHQDLPHQAAIVAGAQDPKADPHIAQAVNRALLNLAPEHRMQITQLLPVHSLNVGKLLSGMNPFKDLGAGPNAAGPGISPAAGEIAGQAVVNPKFAVKIAGNTAKDVVDLPAETFSSVGTIGSDLLSGKVGKAASDIITPYKQLLKNPVGMFEQHPLDTYLMVAGPAHGAARIAGGGVRAAAGDSALGRAVSTDRPGIQLGGKLTHEQPRYSSAPSIKAGQVLAEKAKFKRAPNGRLVPRSDILRNKLTGLETSRMVGINERIRQANRDATIVQRAKAVKPTLGRRVVKGLANSVKYNPDRPVIPGADVLARVADGTIRRPDTFAADIQRHLQQVSTNRPNLLDNPKLLKEHDAYVKRLQAAASEKLSPRDLQNLFDAANKYRQDYSGVEKAAQKFGQFGGRSEDALLKRALSHYAISHMGARFDEEKGIIGGRGRPLSNQQIIAHIRGRNGMAGRMPAFTSDRPKTGSAFYISSERRPLPENKTNTMFAYTHGLTDPTHQALLEQHVRMQGIVDAHHAQNRLVNAISVMRPDGTAWPSYTAALKDVPQNSGMKPIALSQPFHALDSLSKALEGTHPNTLEQEAAQHGLDLNARMHDSGQGRWALADQTAIRRIEEHKAQITSNPTMRAFKMTNNQFRQVALGTSAKHIPGIITEGVIRDISNGVGVQSWITGHRLLKHAEKLDPETGRMARIQLGGGTVSGSAKMMMTRQVSDHFAGTSLERPLRAFEAFMRAPGARQTRNAWRAWTHFAINGTKRYIEEQNQIAGVGKAALRDFGSQHGPFMKAMRLQGSMLDDAARGMVDPVKLRQFRAEVERIYGRWTDLTPTGQTAMMLSPFGLWWTNSVKWLARSPIDRPVQTGLGAAANVGTLKERQARGLDMFSPGAVPGYMQGGIPLSGGKLLAQNYYSPFGVANDPFQSAASLIEPWLQSPLLGALGDNYLGKKLSSPKNPYGDKPSNDAAKAQYIINSMLASFLPLYSKAEQISQGGASAYDSSTLINPQTKTPGQGFGAGLAKTLRPYRLYDGNPPAKKGKSTNPFSGSSSGSNPWAGSSSSSNPFK